MVDLCAPPAEVACHPGDENDQNELYLMCEDLKTGMSALDAKGIHCSEVQEPPGVCLGILLPPAVGSWGFISPNIPRQQSYNASCQPALGISQTNSLHDYRRTEGEISNGCRQNCFKVS